MTPFQVLRGTGVTCRGQSVGQPQAWHYINVGYRVIVCERRELGFSWGKQNPKDGGKKCIKRFVSFCFIEVESLVQVLANSLVLGRSRRADE